MGTVYHPCASCAVDVGKSLVWTGEQTAHKSNFHPRWKTWMYSRHYKSKETHGKEGILRLKRYHRWEKTVNQQQKQKGRGKKTATRAETNILQQPTEKDGDFWHRSTFCRAVTGSTEMWLTGFHTACECTSQPCWADRYIKANERD